MLPPPTLTFTIPSIHDDLVLECRVYHPACLVPTKASQLQQWRKRAAIVAHPYAPLGGCYDDPIVDIMASVILKQGFIVGTFNFRGAGKSKGRTSWQSKAEQNDYISFVGFMVYYLHHLLPPSPELLKQQRLPRSDLDLHDLSPIPSQALPYDEGLSAPASSSIPQIGIDESPATPQRFLLAGYSYGAMITSSLSPMLSSMIQPFQAPPPGSAQAEIRMRAESLAEKQNEIMKERTIDLLSKMHRRGRSLQVEDYNLSSSKIRKASGGVRMGGEEDLRRASHESHRSRSSFAIETPEKVRKSMDRVRSMARSSRVRLGRSNSSGSLPSSNKKASESESSIEKINPDGDIVENPIKPIQGIVVDLQPAYLLVSPLHGWVSSLAKLWSVKSSREKEVESDVKFTVDPTLALFGDDDVFVSVKRLRAWAERLKVAKNEGESCKFRHREVSGAGHFWHDHEAIHVLQEEINAFVATL